MVALLWRSVHVWRCGFGGRTGRVYETLLVQWRHRECSLLVGASVLPHVDDTLGVRKEAVRALTVVWLVGDVTLDLSVVTRDACLGRSGSFSLDEGLGPFVVAICVGVGVSVGAGVGNGVGVVSAADDQSMSRLVRQVAVAAVLVVRTVAMAAAACVRLHLDGGGGAV